jgi:L-lactate dehydrogenase
MAEGRFAAAALSAFATTLVERAGACRDATPRAGRARVRLPGEAGMKRLREQRAHGVALYPTIMPALVPWAEKLGVDIPGETA